MSVTAVVKPKGIFSKKLKLQDILPEGFGYGVMDEYYRLDSDKTGDFTLIYERGYLARGIEVSFKDKEVSFRLSLPNCPHEIELFYMIVSLTCKLLHTKVFYRDDQMAELSQIEQFIQCDIDASKDAWKSTEDMVRSDEYENIITFGVRNPLYIGEKEIEQIGGDLDKFGEFLNEKQQIDAYYAAPHFYQKKDGTIFGSYAIACETRSIVPIEPYVPFGFDVKPEEWYVYLQAPENMLNCVKYDDFIGYVADTEYYDKKHVIITLSEYDISELCRLCGTQI